LAVGSQKGSARARQSSIEEQRQVSSEGGWRRSEDQTLEQLTASVDSGSTWQTIKGSPQLLRDGLVELARK